MAGVNIASAGSPVTMPKFIDGTSVWFLSQRSACVKAPPMLRVCAPFTQLRVSSMFFVEASRELGVGVTPASVMPAALIRRCDRPR